jgi:BRCT domain type II-containing protein
LIVGSEPGASKVEKAAALGTATLDETGLAALLTSS